MPVTDTHTEYNKHLPRWQLVEDCVEGSTAVKSRGGADSWAGSAYLPIPNPSDTSSKNKSRYKAYRDRANFVGFTGHTKDGMDGMVFRRDVEAVLDPSLEYLENNANGGGLSLEQLIRDILNGVLDTGRAGLLVDFPESEEGQTKAQTQNLQASILYYPAKSVINWRTAVIDGVKKLSLVVLKETVEDDKNDEFSVDQKDQFRVLRLMDGVYTIQIYDQGGIPKTKEYTPRQSTGASWKEIPFTFVGSLNNDETIDKSPLYDLAEVNLAHYRNSADYEESCFMVGQPTPVISGLTQDWWDNTLKKTLEIGSRGGIPLPEGGSAVLLQAAPNQMPLEGMKAKESQMIQIGAKLIQDNTGMETAEAAKIRFAGQNSKLAAIVGNIESAMLACLGWCAMYMGGGESELQINREFYDATLDPQTIIAMMQMEDRGYLAKSDIQDRLRKGGLIAPDRTNEDIDAEAETTGFTLTTFGGANDGNA